LFRSKPILEQKVDNSKKIFITTESHEMFILRMGSKGRAFGHCARCKQEVEILGIDRAVSASGLSTSKLMRKIDEGEIHGIETDSGHILICSESLAERDGRKGGGNEEI
jgi:hypothetical protein